MACRKSDRIFVVSGNIREDTPQGAGQPPIDLRTAAMVLAIERIATATLERGVGPWVCTRWRNKIRPPPRGPVPARSRLSACDHWPVFPCVSGPAKR